jgi:AbrB family looped-hinge helix DNA binding protein
MVAYMRTTITTLTERGQVSIPAEIRRQLGLEPGQRLEWEVVSDQECRVRRSPGRRVVGAEAMRGFARQFRPVRLTSAWMAELREGDG